MDRQERIEKVGEANAVGFGHKAEKAAITVETPRAAGGDGFKGRLLLAKKEFGANAASGVLIHDLEDVRAVPLDTDQLSDSFGQNALHKAAWGKFFESSHLRGG
jgi:hypothetical protein